MPGSGFVFFLIVFVKLHSFRSSLTEAFFGKKLENLLLLLWIFSYFLNWGQAYYHRKWEYCNLKLQEQANSGHIRWLSFSACPPV